MIFWSIVLQFIVINWERQFFMINFRTMTPWRTMTFSILAIDRKTGTIGGAAATGSLCVGGWVLRGDPRSGMSASQGAAPSTFWGEDVLFRMAAGETARTAVGAVTASDSGRAFRQLAAATRPPSPAPPILRRPANILSMVASPPATCSPRMPCSKP